MTACVAAMFRFIYENGDQGHAIITASDRMLTMGEFEYQPPQRKIGQISSRILVLVAGSYTVHAEALGNTGKHLADSPTEDVAAVAEIYASYMRKYRLREAVQTYLAPIGLDETSFSKVQQSMSGSVVSDLVSQMQNHPTNAEAIIAGCDASRAYLFHIDGRGFVTSHSDPGFVSIGNGGLHANSEIMASEFASSWPFAPAVLLLYAAKKRSEVAPGVGNHTDMQIITRDGISPLTDPLQKKIEDIYSSALARSKRGVNADEEELLAFLKTIGQQVPQSPLETKRDP